VQLISTGDPARDIVENTQAFNHILEGVIRQNPDQWLWIHRRWKTRPEGEPSLYDVVQAVNRNDDSPKPIPRTQSSR
jgi:hypothetical protein